MLRACVVVVLFLSLFATPLSAACDAPKVFDRPFREIALDLAIAGGDLWVATSHGVSLWSRTSAAAIRAGSVAVPGSTTTLVAVPGGVWAGSGTTLHFIDRPSMVVTSSIDIGSPINDLVEQAGFLYAATPSGIVQVDVLDRAHPVEARTLSTTSGGALSLALLGQTLYAADGSRSFDAFTLTIPALPQKIGTIKTAGRTTSVRAAGSRLIASDGQQSEVLSGSGGTLTSTAVVPFGGRSAALLSGSVLFLAGSDRQIRAVDVLATPPAVLASFVAPITEGSVNRVGSLELVEGDLYVAAGDAGLLAWDTTALRPPYPFRSVAAGATGSGWVFGDRVVVAPEGGGLQRYAESGGQIIAGPRWEGSTPWVIHDGDALRILASSGARIELFDAGAPSPASLGSISLRAAVRSAILPGQNRAIAVLADGSAWTVDFSATPPLSAQISVPGTPQFIARGGSAVAMAEVRNDGTTAIRYWPAGDLSVHPEETILQGASNGGIAVAPDVVAAATFEGLVLVGFGATDGIRVVPGTNFAPVRDLHIEGERIFVVTANRVEVRSLEDGAWSSAWTPGGDARAVQAAGSKAIVATSSGFDVIDLGTESALPSPLALPPAASRYYRSMEGDGTLLWVADRNAVDVFRITASGTPAFSRSIPLPAPVVAFAALGGKVFTATAGGTITGIDASGQTVASLEIDESPDQEVIGLSAAGGTLWLSLRVGCLTTGCAGRTVVVDARSGTLARTASLEGSAVDLAVSNDRAAAVFTLPAELRTYSIADPAHPVALATRAAEGTPVSIELADGIVWTLGDRLRSWFEDSLAPRSVHLDPYSADPAGRVSYLDQEVHALGSCLYVVGRDTAPQRYTISGSSLVPAPPIEASGAMRDLAPTASGFILLGETSLEAWSSAPPPDGSRRRLVGR